MSKRIYSVTDGATAITRLVRAANQAQALSHVARSTFSVQVASQNELVAQLQSGTKVEEAGAEPEPETTESTT